MGLRSLLHVLVPQRRGSQIAVLLITSIVLAHAVTTATFFFRERPLFMIPHSVEIERLVFFAKLLDAVPDSVSKADLLRSAQKINPEIKLLSEFPLLNSQIEGGLLIKDIRKNFGDRLRVFEPQSQSNGSMKSPGLSVAFRLSSGAALTMPLSFDPPPPGFWSPILIGILFFLVAPVVLLSLWAARALISPLTHFADVAEHFTLSSSNTLLVEQGPIEVRKLAEALNNMQRRVRQMVDERTQMLAAVSHDLRTPITRLRLRAEDIGKDGLKRKIVHDLETMESLVHSTLSFLRDETLKSRKVKTDLASLVQVLCDDYTDQGRRVEPVDISHLYVLGEPDPHLYVVCDPEQLSRAISNLIENGLKFGQSVAVQINAPTVHLARIEVRDDGPGIPDVEKEKVLKPFYRGDTARDLNDDDSFGLGLSIVKSIVDAHDGKLEMFDAKPAGLIVRLTLPTRC